MKRFLTFVGIFLALILALLVIVPLVFPIQPLTDTRPPQDLADPDSRFIRVNGLEVHYQEYGSGEPVMILLHGFGASTFSWREVTAPLSGLGRVIAYDRPAFGLTERPLPGSWTGPSPYGAQANVDLLFGLMDSLGVQKAILIGNSAGGRVAVQAALQRPDRVSGLVLVDAAIYTGGGDRFGALRFIIDTPQMSRMGPYFARSIAGEQGQLFLQTAWHDPAKITAAIQAGYRKPLSVQNWDVALWEFTKAGSGSEDLAPRLKELGMPVLVVTGDDDRIVPTADSLRLAQDIPGAKLSVFPACGHVPHEECPRDWLAAVEPFIQSVQP